MKKPSTLFVCSNCGGEHTKWSGRCSYCGAWNTLKEMTAEAAYEPAAEKAKSIKLDEVESKNFVRLKSGISEFDLVFGGGIVPGSVNLLGGNPGIGKSTLVFQVASQIAGTVVYIAGEESPDQIKLRADRIAKKYSNILVFEAQDINSWMNEVVKINPQLLVIDSIQTVYDSNATGTPGSIMQVKNCALKILSLAKKHSIATIMIGHVTKEGEVAGPKTLEHLVDAVFYLEGEDASSERYLRIQKNRFGPTDEVGIFRLLETGLVDASSLGRITPEKKIPIGVARTAALEGSRVHYVEVQTLVQKTELSFPRRNAVGYDLNRLILLLAVLGKYTKISLSSFDVFLSISGGYKLKDPIADLAVLFSLASSFLNKPLSGENLFLGEVDLAGRIHLPESAKKIISHAKKLGYKIVSDPNLTINQIFQKIL